MTEGGDLKFRVYNSKITNDLIPLSQVESHSVMEEGELICDQPGQCKWPMISLVLVWLPV